MKAILASVVFGFGQAVLLCLLFAFIKQAKKSELWLVCLIKFLSYGVAASALMFIYQTRIVAFLCGYIAAFAITLVIALVYKNVFYGKKIVNFNWQKIKLKIKK